MYVQNFDDSRGLAIRITYRISLRSSSLWKPRHPLLKVVLGYIFEVRYQMYRTLFHSDHLYITGAGGYRCCAQPKAFAQQISQKEILDRCGNDPSAGSPTETLLRLHLPLNDKV